MTDEDRKILEQIVERNGRCLDAKRCTKCPFRASCLPDFLEPSPPSAAHRFRIAFDALANSMLLDDHAINEQVED